MGAKRGVVGGKIEIMEEYLTGMDLAWEQAYDMACNYAEWRFMVASCQIGNERN